MKIFEFLDIEFQLVSVKNGNAYSLFSDGRAKALHSIIGFLRSAAKWLSVPLIIGKFLLMKAHLIDEPISPLKPREPELEASEEMKVTQPVNA